MPFQVLTKLRRAQGRVLVRQFQLDLSQQSQFLEMAEAAYRLGRGTLFELLDARRTLVEASAARIELLGGIAEAQLELRAIAGKL